VFQALKERFSGMNEIPELKVGDKAPLFTLLDQEGNKVALGDFRGKQPVVLIFYPGDETPGCTAQLCAVRDDWSEFKKYKAAVYGINHADANSHTKFWRHHGLKTPLLIDEGKKISAKYGALRKYFRATIIRRTVIVIDTQGVIRYLRRGLPPTSEIVQALKSL